MNKKLDIINLAAEFASEDLNLSLSADHNSGSITLEENWREVVSLSYRPDVIDVTVDFIDENGHEGYTPHRFYERRPDAWAKAKILFRQTVLDFLKGKEQN